MVLIIEYYRAKRCVVTDVFVVVRRIWIRNIDK